MGQETSKVTYDPLFTNQMVRWQSPMDYVNTDKEQSSTQKHKHKGRRRSDNINEGSLQTEYIIERVSITNET